MYALDLDFMLGSEWNQRELRFLVRTIERTTWSDLSAIQSPKFYERNTFSPGRSRSAGDYVSVCPYEQAAEICSDVHITVLTHRSHAPDKPQVSCSLILTPMPRL